MSHHVQNLMKQSKKLRNKSSTSFFELEKYLDFMQKTILQTNNFLFACGSKPSRCELFDKLFFQNFQHLSQLQQAKYYYHMVKIVYQYVNCRKTQNSIDSETNQITHHKPKQYGAEIIKKGFFKNVQSNHSLQINQKNSRLILKSQNNPYDLEFNIQNYLIRQSKKNSLEKGRHVFAILKSSRDSTPDQMRFSIKNVYQFPQFFDKLWLLMLQKHGQRLQKIIKQLSSNTSRRGHVQIILLHSNQSIIENLNSDIKNNSKVRNNQQQLSEGSSQKRQFNNYQFLDVKHPSRKLTQQKIQKLCTKQNELNGVSLWGIEWQKNKKGFLKNKNYQYIAVQRNAVKKMIKNLISMGNGQSSMPIQMFGNQTNTLQLAKAFKYFPYFFIDKKQPCYQKQSVIIDGFKKILCSIIGFLLVRNRMQKPLQPLLGQTYQGFIGNYPIYVEQIAKNKSYVLFQTQEFKIYGSLQLKTQICGINSIKAGSIGYLTLQIKSIQKSPKIIFTFPMFQLDGLIYGDRLVKIEDTSIIYEQQSNTFCLLKWGKDKRFHKQHGKHYQSYSQRQDFVNGSVIKLKSQKRFQIEKYISDKDYARHFYKQEDIDKNLLMLYGNWTNQIFCDSYINKNVRIFKIQDQKPYQMYHYKYYLPSDSRLRKDVKCIQCQNWTQASKQRRKNKENQDKQFQLRQNQLNKQGQFFLDI